jgi:hypothetical protein
MSSAVGLYSTQVCHSATPPARGGGTTVALAEVMSAHSAVKHEPGSAWQLRFGHLVPYSAAYYRRAHPPPQRPSARKKGARLGLAKVRPTLSPARADGEQLCCRF